MYQNLWLWNSLAHYIDMLWQRSGSDVVRLRATVKQSMFTNGFWQFAGRKRLQSVHAGLAPTWWFSVPWSICLGSSHLAVVWFSWFSIGSNSDSSLHVLLMTMEFLGGSNRRPGLGLIAASSTSLDQDRRHDGVHVVIPLLDTMWCYRFITFGLTWRDNILEEIHMYFGIHMYTYKMATDSRLP